MAEGGVADVSSTVNEDSGLPQVTSCDESDAIVEMYDQMFTERYSSADEGYQRHLQSKKPPPPCVKNWFPKQNRNFDRSRGGGRGYHHHGNYNRNYGNQRYGGYENERHSRGRYGQGHGYSNHGNQSHNRRYQPY